MAPLWQIDTQHQPVWLNAAVRIDRRTAPPLGVFIKAFAASAVYWDGRLIGHNGIPARTAAREVPGFRDAVIAIPPDLSRAGVHRLQIHMSTMRAPVRLASPVVSVSVAPFEPALQPALRNYLAALVSAGALVIVTLCLALVGWRRDRIGPLGCLIAAAVLATAQLAAESSRAFVAMTYPAQVVRLEAVLLFSCGFGVLFSVYLWRRFRPSNGGWVCAAQLAVIVFIVLAVPAFDDKVAWVLSASATSSLALTIAAVRRAGSGAVSISILAGACLLLGLAEPAAFLDRDFYIWAVIMFATLLTQEALATDPTSPRHGSQTVDPAPLWLGSGATRHLVSPCEILRLAAADDYTEVFVAGGAAVLHPEPLHKLLERLPPGFVRVHRSHAVNLAHLESFRKGPRSSVTLSDRSVAPVSRRSLPKLMAAISA